MHCFRSVPFLGLSLLMACSGEPPLPVPPGSPEVPPATSATVKKNAHPSDFRGEAVPLEPANRYRVDLKWETPTAGRCLVDREDVPRKERTAFPEIDCAAGSFRDELSAAGRRYRYRLRVLEPGGAVSESTTEVTVPRDLVLRGDHLAPPLDGVARLFLTKGAVVRTDGIGWRGTLDELVAEDAVIQTFTEGVRPTASGAAGRSAAEIHLRIRRARGTLAMRLFGQDGSDGAPGTTGTAGKDGTDGKRAELDMAPDFPSVFPFLVAQTSDILKKAWDGVEQNENVRKRIRCASPATNGGDGLPGTAGTAGQPGGAGGASPRTLVVIEDASELRGNLPVARGGRGGSGGPGGDGGVGGRGGKAGTTDKSGVCPATEAGKDGANGLAGAEGPAGKDGKVLPVCIVVGGSRSGDCEPFEDEIDR